MKFSIDHIPYDDPKTWELIQSGYTNCVFQCESKLVQSWLRKIRPRNIWELSVVVSLVRPGPLKSGFADQYVKNRETSQVESFNNNIIDDIFKSTDGVMVYQEQIMFLGARLAWNHLPEIEKLIKVDILRKAVGKKNQQKILEIGKDFVEGCLHNNLDTEIANKLFDIIKNCGRYAFNLSHSIKYARLGYQTAYLKCHFPLQTISTYLTYTKYKMKKWEEIHKIINESKIFNITILPPKLNSNNENFKIENQSIRYGLSSIKYIGEDKAKKINNAHVKINNLIDFLKLCFTDSHGLKLDSRAIEALIYTGSFDLPYSRKSLLNIFKFVSELNNKQQIVLISLLENNNAPSLIEAIQNIINDSKLEKTRIKLQSYLEWLDLNAYDDPAWIENQERTYLGISLSATRLDKKDMIFEDKCIYAIEDAPNFSKLKLGVILDEIKFTKTKKGNNPGQDMAIIKVHDDSGEISSLPVFPDLYDQCSQYLIQNNTLIIDITKRNNGWIIENLVPL